MQDLKLALRLLTKSPGFTAVVVFSLALGIGANATVLCWLRNLVLRPLPGIDRQGEIVVVLSNQGSGNVSVLDLQDVATLPDLFAGAAASQTTTAALTVEKSLTWIEGQVVSANFFSLLGVRPILGRTFLPDEDQKPGGNPVLVIDENLWRRQFGADAGIVGRVVDLNRHSFTIIGVVPAAFRGTMTPSVFDFWAPLSMIYEVRSQALSTTKRDVRGWHDFARLRPGVSVAQTQAAVATLDRNLTAAYPDYNHWDGPMAAGYLMLAARALGYGTVFITDSIPDEVTRKVLNIPDRYTRVCFTPLGVPGEWPASPKKKFPDDFIAYETL